MLPDTAALFMSSMTGSNPFAHAKPPDTVDIRNLNIHEQVLVCLFQTDSSSYAWKTYFSLVFPEYNLLDHVYGTVDCSLVPDHHEWSAIDATLIR
ncbi:Tubby-like F-box protein [Hordeum vulgare]|nr:Tubby-like F-box protein [Hordeum vulgare]